MSAMPLKQTKVLLVSLERQGCTLKRTKNGWMIYTPSGESITFHLSNSDHRATQDMRSRVRRAGLQWPFDKN